MAYRSSRRWPLRGGVTLAFALGLAAACSQGPNGEDDDDGAGESGAPHGGTSNVGGGGSGVGGSASRGGTGGTTGGGAVAGSGNRGGTSPAGGSGGTGGGQPHAGGGNVEVGGSGGTTSRSGAGGAGGTGGGSSGSTSFPPTCQYGCATLDDCPVAEFYSCENGLCVYGGCESDAQCASVTPGTVCRPFPFYGYSTCVPTCATVADCSLSSPAFDEDNYECLDGGCVHHGCNDDAECDAYVAGYVCYDAPGTYPSCSTGCAVPEDCISLDSLPAYSDPERYQCVSGKCVYSGCESDAECNVENLAITYVCRVFEP